MTDENKNNAFIKFIRIFAYIFALPVGFIVATLFSWIISVSQNLFNAIFCNITILPKWFLTGYMACTGDYSQRTFLADVMFNCILITVTAAIIPNYKELTMLIVTIISSLLYGFVVLLIVLNGNLFQYRSMETVCLFIGLIIWAVVQFKKLKKANK